MFGLFDIPKAVVDHMGLGALEQFGESLLYGDDGFELSDVDVEFGQVVDGFEVKILFVEAAISLF